MIGSDHVWIVGQADAGKNRCSPSSVANVGRRFKAASYSGGLPDPFGSSSTFNNTRGLRLKIWTNP